jgi:hypothetical protein
MDRVILGSAVNVEFPWHLDQILMILQIDHLQKNIRFNLAQCIYRYMI